MSKIQNGNRSLSLVRAGERSEKGVAMESTGLYWIPIFQILEERGLEVWLGNAPASQERSGAQN